jgi:3-oxoacyl-[acyl-carrier protein] reductase
MMDARPPAHKEKDDMLLDNRNAVIYGAGGAIGSAVSRAFAREGARVFLTGRTPTTLDAVAKEIAAAGGTAETDEVDALDECAVNDHAEAAARKAGSIDVSFNVISVPHVQGVGLVDLAVDDFTDPIQRYARTHFLTARAAARYMARKRSGAILMMTTTPARRAIPYVGPFGTVCAAIEGFAHSLAGELGRDGIRVVCLLSSGSPDAAGVQEVFARHARARGLTGSDWLESYRQQTLLRRLTTLEEVANVATFVASERASAVTGTAVNLSCGMVVD